MARKMMTKEVTKTTVKLGKVEMEDGTPKLVHLPDEIEIGNVTLEKAQRLMDKKHNEKVTVFEVQPNTEVYEMAVEEFIKLATIKTQEEKVEAKA